MASKDSGKNAKLVRDSFTIPKNEFATIEVLKTRAIAMGTSIKKSELLRAGLMVLKGLNDAAFKSALAAVPTLKTGRPVTAKPAQKLTKVATKPKAPAAPKAVKPAAKASPVKAAAPKPTPKPAEKAAPARSAQKTRAPAASRARAASAPPAVKATKPAPTAKAPAAPAPAKTAEAAR